MAKKQKPRKTIPVSNDIIVVNGKEYVYYQLQIVATHAPVTKVEVGKLIDSNPTGNKSIDDDVLRICKLSKTATKFVVLTGFNKVTQANANEETVIDATLVSLNYLDRCLVPPKTLGHDELEQKLTNNEFADSGIRISVGKQNRRSGERDRRTDAVASQ